MSEITIPAEVAKAIVTVMTGVKTLGKVDTNKFQKYDFVSVDRFLEAVGPLCAAAGLIILQEEEAVDVATKETTDDYGKTKTSAWLTIRYGFTFAHSSGAAYGPMHRTVMVPANGAQAFGSAQSYALKQFMRAQFQIPTGDKDDADHQQATPLPSRPAPQKQDAPTKKVEAKTDDPFSGPAPVHIPVPIDQEGSGSDWKAWATRLLPARIAAATTAEEVQAVLDANKDALDTLKGVSSVAYEALKTRWTDRLEQLFVNDV